MDVSSRGRCLTCLVQRPTAKLLLEQVLPGIPGN